MQPRDYMRAPEGRPPMLEAFWRAPATWTIMGINLAAFLFAEFHGSTENPLVLIRLGASQRELIWSGEYWRLITSIFMHIGFMHFFWNSYAMFGWCAPVEAELGWRKFALVYVLSGIGASAVSVLCHSVVSAGASGAGFGIIGVVLALDYRRTGDWQTFFSDPRVRSNLFGIVLWTGLGLYLLPMDHYAHLGGFVFGALLGWVFTLDDYDERLRLPAAAGVAVLLIGTVVASAYPWFGQQPRFSTEDLRGWRSGMDDPYETKKYGRLTLDFLSGLADEQLPEAVHGHIRAKVGGNLNRTYQIVTSLPKRFQHVYTTFWVDAAVADGGFHRYFWGPQGQFAFEAIEGFKALGAPEAAKLLEEAVEVFKKNNPDSLRFGPQGSATEEAPAGQEEFERLNKRYDLSGRDLEKLQIRFIKKHLQEFVTD